jgi:hypothetical protein
MYSEMTCSLECQVNDTISSERTAPVIRVEMFLVYDAMQIAKEVTDFLVNLHYLSSGLQILKLSFFIISNLIHNLINSTETCRGVKIL